MSANKNVTDLSEQMQMISNCKACRIGIYDNINDEVYIVPMNFGYEYDEKFILYFHSSKRGRKYDLIKPSKKVGFQMDTPLGLIKGDTACSHSYAYNSIIGNGIISLVDSDSEKQKALNLIMSHYTDKADWEYNPKYFKGVAIYKLICDKISFVTHK